MRSVRVQLVTTTISYSADFFDGHHRVVVRFPEPFSIVQMLNLSA